MNVPNLQQKKRVGKNFSDNKYMKGHLKSLKQVDFLEKKGVECGDNS